MKGTPAPKYQGVIERQGAFYVRITVERKLHRGGHWPTAQMAAMARDRLVLSLGLDLPLHFPEESCRLGGATAAELLREARTERKAARGKSRYAGVFRLAGSTIWRVRTGTRGQQVGGFDTEEEAAIAYDRVARYRGVSSTYLNFPERELTPISPEELLAEMQEHQRRTRGFLGVTPMRGRFLALVSVGGSAVSAGTWDTEREAALARDRAALSLGLPVRYLNLPDEALAAGPATPGALQREALLQRRTERHTSRFLGVQWETDLQKWRAFVSMDTTYTPIGVFADEEKAAVARDRLWLHLGADPDLLNFPGRKLEPASLDQLRAEVHESFKEGTSSQFTGVCFSAGKWLAYITVGGRRHNLGSFKDEVEAAKAHDEGARRLGATRARLNFG